MNKTSKKIDIIYKFSNISYFDEKKTLLLPKRKLPFVKNQDFLVHFLAL